MASRKFRTGDIVFGNKPIAGVHELTALPFFAVVVDYQPENNGKSWYRLVRVLHPFNGKPYGESFLMQPHELVKTKYPSRPRYVATWRANNKLEERGCTCNCCAHEAIAPRFIRMDGSFTWDTQD